jgi:pSer/pThr/pTyr-binding forkhead associated (FHA) protein
MYQLVFQPNTRSSLCVDFDGQVLSVGRSEDNDIVIDDPAVSACHARLCLEEGALFVVDLGSSNGTWLNGRQVGRERLAPGDVLSIARRVEVLVLEDDESEGFVRPDPAVLKELAESVRSLFVRKDAVDPAKLT